VNGVFDFDISPDKFPDREKKDITVGILIETKIANLGEHDRDNIESKEESQFHKIIELINLGYFELGKRGFKYKVVDRRHLKNILEEQKLSTSGITDSETVKLGKILNLDIIVLRLIYEKSQVTKVLKVDNGEVLLFKTYEDQKKKDGSFMERQIMVIGIMIIVV